MVTAAQILSRRLCGHVLFKICDKV